jgi:hypothetical protein
MNTAKQAGQSAKNLAQQIAKQMAQEPLEVLKTARDQVTSPEGHIDNQPPSQNIENSEKASENQQKLQDQMRSTRRMEALNQEIKDIHKQDLFKDLQDRIAQGEEVPIADFTELSMEQKQVLKAQMEAYKNQMSKVKNQNTLSEVPVMHSKPSRRFGAGQKQEAEKQQTRVEKPVPPSG